jgi:Flp pilus assembly protein CpaB
MTMLDALHPRSTPAGPARRPTGRLRWPSAGAGGRLLAATLAAIAVLLTIAAIRRPAGSEGFAVLVAAADVPGGTVLAPGHLRTVQMPGDLRPAGSMARPQQALGHTLAAPLRRGEVVTDVRLLGPGLLASVPAAGGSTGTESRAGVGSRAGTASVATTGRAVAAPVRVADREAVGLLRVGDRVDVLAAVTNAATPPVNAAVPNPQAPASNGPTSDGPTSDGPTSEGAASEGAAPDGPTSEGAASEGAAPDGPAAQDPGSDLPGPGAWKRGTGTGSGQHGALSSATAGAANDTAVARPPAAVTVAADALVLALPRPSQDGPPGEGALVVLAVTPDVAAALAGAAATTELSVVVRPSPGTPR